MSKMIPDASGTVRISGMEEKVSAYKTKSVFLKGLTGEVDALKVEFRKTALEHVTACGDAAGAVKRIEFMSAEGAVAVALPDTSKAGNRLVLTDEVLAGCAAAGIDLAPLVETERKFVLTGQWVEWFSQYLAQIQATGGQIPAGVEEQSSTKLNAGAVSMLRAMVTGLPDLDPRKGVARTVLEKALKAPSVSTK